MRRGASLFSIRVAGVSSARFPRVLDMDVRWWYAALQVGSRGHRWSVLKSKVYSQGRPFLDLCVNCLLLTLPRKFAGSYSLGRADRSRQSFHESVARARSWLVDFVDDTYTKTKTNSGKKELHFLEHVVHARDLSDLNRSCEATTSDDYFTSIFWSCLEFSTEEEDFASTEVLKCQTHNKGRQSHMQNPKSQNWIKLEFEF